MDGRYFHNEREIIEYCNIYYKTNVSLSEFADIHDVDRIEANNYSWYIIMVMIFGFYILMVCNLLCYILNPYGEINERDIIKECKDLVASGSPKFLSFRRRDSERARKIKRSSVYLDRFRSNTEILKKFKGAKDRARDSASSSEF